METLEFELDLAELPVRFKTKGGPIHEAYLKELTGKQRDRYMDDITKRVQMKNGKVDGMKTFEGIQSNLLAICLHKKEDDTLYTKSEIQEFPARVQESLFEAAQDISGLAITAEDAEKND